MAKKPPETVRLKPSESKELMNKAWELSKKADEMYRESELVHILIEQGLDRIEYKNGKLKLV